MSNDAQILWSNAKSCERNEEPIDAENLQCGDMTHDGTWHAADCVNPKPYHCKLTPGIRVYP